MTNTSNKHIFHYQKNDKYSDTMSVFFTSYSPEDSGELPIKKSIDLQRRRSAAQRLKTGTPLPTRPPSLKTGCRKAGFQNMEAEDFLFPA
jgi:hypothetical protein